MNLQEKPGNDLRTELRGDKLGLYVHVPFCATTCDFCAFYQQEPRKQDITRYLEGIGLDLAHQQVDRPFDTVFFGGGTPGLLPTGALESLCGLLAPHVRADAEWSVELAPALVNPAKSRILRRGGVTRASLGVQSLDEAMLRRLGREHSPKQARRSLELLREAGFPSVNLDMMFAMPGQSAEHWHADLAEAIALEPDHISTYCLTFEEDTKLWVKLQQGAFKRDIEQERMLYTQSWDQLEAAGYAHYEVSNFARKGHNCEHNRNTWTMQEWVGLGPSAASQYRLRRRTHVASLERWHAGLLSGAPQWEDDQPLDAATLALDAVIFGLRMGEGIVPEALRERFGQGAWDRGFALGCAELEAEGLLERADDRIRLTREGMLLADSVAGHFMERWSDV